MALKNRFYTLILLLGIGFWGCSTPPLGDMPSYDDEAVNSHYLSIIQHEAIYFRAMQLMNQGVIPESHKAQAEKALDRYIYYSAVAKVYVFNSQWAESEQADNKSLDALVDLIKIITSNAL